MEVLKLVRFRLRVTQSLHYMYLYHLSRKKALACALPVVACDGSQTFRAPTAVSHPTSHRLKEIPRTANKLHSQNHDSIAWLLIQVYIARFATRMLTVMSPSTLRQTVAL
jgi:hypothetical protein